MAERLSLRQKAARSDYKTRRCKDCPAKDLCAPSSPLHQIIWDTCGYQYKSGYTHGYKAKGKEMREQAKEAEKKQEKDIVTITCYGETEQKTRKEALRFYKEAVRCCEGAERDRYMDIVEQLEDGLTNITDR